MHSLTKELLDQQKLIDAELNFTNDTLLSMLFSKCKEEIFDKTINRNHSCNIERGHEGQHECQCGIKWNDNTIIEFPSGD
jgi:hypothetical protein